MRVASASRLAVASLERATSALGRTGKKPAPPVPPQEMADRERMLRRPLPPSYRAVAERSSQIGGRETLLDAAGMARKKERIDDVALVPFAEGAERELFCFDRKSEGEAGELVVYAWKNGEARQVAPSFALWLDEVADRIEEEIASAADVPESLRSLLVQLGFRSTIRSSGASRPATSPRSRSSSGRSSRARCAESTNACSTRAARRRSR